MSAAADADSKSNSIALLSVSELENLIQTKTFVILKVGATWCKPCKVLQPILDKLIQAYAHKQNLQFAHVDVDQVEELDDYLRIKELPTLVAFYDGQRYDTSRERTFDKLQAWIDSCVKACVQTRTEGSVQTK